VYDSSSFADQLKAEPLRLALMADDLTGAADAAVEFCEAGFSVSVGLSEDSVAQSEAEICAISTESRELDEGAAREAVRRWATILRRAGRQVVFMKVDSMLRGNNAAETAELVRSFGFARAVLCAALPRLGRICREGYLRTQDGRDVPLPTDQALATPDAETDEDLARIAAGILTAGEALLPAGSSGLARPWARELARLRGRNARKPQPPAADRPTLCVIGSVHSRSLQQMEHAVSTGVLEEVDGNRLGGGTPARSQLRRASIGAIPDGWTDELCKTIASGRFGSLVLSGGSTLGLVFDALGVEAFEIGGPTTAGAPWGTIRGRIGEGLTVVTKSGAFGDPDELARIVRSLSREGA
jgi:uncharacterized protein YgbK (DUF1537 family)